ncbi:Uncharacterised protein [Serratia marcescens]|uniref:Uncharacterized protein n=1 Tax=Serratia marcescens TaxID=615 RepID=A0A379YND4_SERMA|nr:Uncharacterised protein [Serratia marcescens]
MAQCVGALRLVMLNAVVIELDARLHHQRDSSQPGIVQLGFLPGDTMRFQRLRHRLRRGDLQTRQRLLRAARHRHLGADHIDRRFAAALRPGAFRHRAQTRRPLGNRGIPQGRGIIGARHGTIEVNFAKSGANVIVYQGFRQRHRFLSRAILPGVWPQMIATQPHALARQAHFIRQTPQPIAELGRRLAGIAAELIDLVGRRLHQHRRAAGFGLPQRGLQNPGMGRTDGKDPDRHTGLVLLDKL